LSNARRLLLLGLGLMATLALAAPAFAQRSGQAQVCGRLCTCFWDTLESYSREREKESIVWGEIVAQMREVLVSEFT
jgi:hypothetical protein